MMVCGTTYYYFILVNGEPKGMINPSQGIRKGDLLSPLFLFLFYFIFFEIYMNSYYKLLLLSNIRGFSWCKNGSRLTHLLFADDSFLFFRTTQHTHFYTDSYHKLLLLSNIRGFSRCKNSSRLTHFLFADDSLLFCRAIQQVHFFRKIIIRYFYNL